MSDYQAAMRGMYEEGRVAGIKESADLAEQLLPYCGANVQPAIAQIIDQIRNLADGLVEGGAASAAATPAGKGETG